MICAYKQEDADQKLRCNLQDCLQNNEYLFFCEIFVHKLYCFLSPFNAECPADNRKIPSSMYHCLSNIHKIVSRTTTGRVFGVTSPGGNTTVSDSGTPKAAPGGSGTSGVAKLPSAPFSDVSDFFSSSLSLSLVLILSIPWETW